MSTLKADLVTAVTTNGALKVKGLGSGKVKIGDGELIWPDADGSANQYIKTDGSANLAFATLPTAGFTLGTETATTSGNSVIIGSIPTGTKIIIAQFEGCSTDGTGAIGLRLGDSGGLETSGYISNSVDVSASPQVLQHTTRLGLVSSFIAARAFYGSAILTLKDATNNTWCMSSVINDANDENNIGSGTKSLSGELTQIAVNSGNTWDAGDFSIFYM